MNRRILVVMGLLLAGLGAAAQGQDLDYTYYEVPAQERQAPQGRKAKKQARRRQRPGMVGYLRDSVYRRKFSAGKLDALRESQRGATINLTNESSIPDKEYRVTKRDTFQIVDFEGREMLIMKAVKDEESGEMVATEQIDAAVVTARFRNVAERHGKVDLQFDIKVPKEMMDSKWQLRFYPDMYILQDSIRLDPVIITGAGYRKAQLKGYQQYEKFLSKIVSDTTKFIDIDQLEIFLQRNIPQVFAFKTDSSEVSDEMFYSYYGVSEQKAVDHYTNKFLLHRNRRLRDRRGEMYRRYVKAPIVTEGIRLDTVLLDTDGGFKYCYTQTINTRPKLRKVDIVLSGEIYEQDRKIYTIPRSEPLTFYISSVSSFVDMKERYLTQVIERRVAAAASYRIEFELGKADVRPGLGDNALEIASIKRQLATLMENTVFDLDSILVSATASPEGTFRNNERLSQRRSEAVSKYFRTWMNHYQDSLILDRGFSVDEFGNVVKEKKADIPFQSSCYPENWKALDVLVGRDSVMTDDQREHYFSLADMADMDAREARMKTQPYYKHLKDDIYPKLRTVTFDFHLHRKGMVKDTVHTTVLDTTYMRGLEAIRDRDYEAAAVLLGSYHDYNTAIAYVCLDRNQSAFEILRDCEKTAQVNYMLALLYARFGQEAEAVQHYVRSCQQDPTYVHRGNLDPEISALIKLYGLNRQEEDEYSY